MKSRKSWHDKLHDSKDLPKVVVLTEAQARRAGAKPGDTMVVPAPLEVDEAMRRVPRGHITTINEIRHYLAVKHNATTACPMTTGIFARIAAEAAEEAAAAGDSDITPYWRILKGKGELNPKYPGGVERQRERLQAEGIPVVQKGKRWVVPDYQERLVSVV